MQSLEKAKRITDTEITCNTEVEAHLPHKKSPSRHLLIPKIEKRRKLFSGTGNFRQGTNGDVVLLFDNSDEDADDSDSTDPAPPPMKSLEKAKRITDTEITCNTEEAHLPHQKSPSRHLLIPKIEKRRKLFLGTGNLRQGKGTNGDDVLLFRNSDEDADDSDNNGGDPEMTHETNGNEADKIIPRRSFDDSEKF